MKILISLLCSFCVLTALFSPVYGVETTDDALLVETDSPEPPKNYVFSEEELANTEFEGKSVEIIDGELYVDGRSATAAVVWLLVQGSYIAVGLIANGTFQQILDTYSLVDEAVSTCLFYWNRYQIITDMYLNSSQQLTSFKMSNGNECVANPSGTSFACKFSLRDGEI